MELGIRFSSYCRSVICSIWNSISCLVSGTGLSSFVQINIYVRLPFPVVLFNPLFFCLRQGRIPHTVDSRAGLAGTSSISAYSFFGVVHISFNVNQVIHSHCLRKTWRIAVLWACKARWSPRGKKAISRPFAVAIRAARLYTAWLRYRFYVVVNLKGSIPAILECLFSSARSFARSKQDEVAPLRRQGPFRTWLTSSCSTRPYF